jgi:DNA polymerase bacteriophage-type
LFFMHGKHFCIQLPSGRVLVYRHARIADRVPGYFKTLGIEPRTIPTIVYAHPHGREGSLYGGLIAENIDQASCRDLLALTLVQAEERFMCPVLHVHDEVVCEVPDDRAESVLNELCLMMTIAPAWAQGLPILVEGMTCQVYSKTPFKNSVKLDMLNGVKVQK